MIAEKPLMTFYQLFIIIVHEGQHVVQVHPRKLLIVYLGIGAVIGDKVDIKGKATPL